MLTKLFAVYLAGDTLIGNRLKPEGWGVEEKRGGFVVYHIIRIMGAPIKMYLRDINGTTILDHDRLSKAHVFDNYEEAYRNTNHYMRKSQYNFLLEEAEEATTDAEKKQLLNIYSYIKDY